MKSSTRNPFCMGRTCNLSCSCQWLCICRVRTAQPEKCQPQHHTRYWTFPSFLSDLAIAPVPARRLNVYWTKQNGEKQGEECGGDVVQQDFWCVRHPKTSVDRHALFQMAVLQRIRVWELFKLKGKNRWIQNNMKIVTILFSFSHRISSEETKWCPSEEQLLALS